MNLISKNPESFKDKKKELIPDIYSSNVKSQNNFNTKDSFNVHKSLKQNSNNLQNSNLLKSKSKERIKSSFPSLAYGSNMNFNNHSNNLLGNDNCNKNLISTVHKRPLTNKTFSHSKFNNGNSSKINKSNSRNKLIRNYTASNQDFRENNENEDNYNSILDDSTIKNCSNSLLMNIKNMFAAYSNNATLLSKFTVHLKTMKNESKNKKSFSFNKENTLGNNKITKIDFSERLKHIKKLLTQENKEEEQKNTMLFRNYNNSKNNGSSPIEQLKNVRIKLILRQ